MLLLSSKLASGVRGEITEEQNRFYQRESIPIDRMNESLTVLHDQMGTHEDHLSLHPTDIESFLTGQNDDIIFSLINASRDSSDLSAQTMHKR